MTFRRSPLVPAVMLLLLVSSGSPVAASAQSGQISLESLCSPDPDKRVDYSGTPPAGLAWVDENHYIERRAGAWMRVDAVSGEAEPAVDTARLRDRLALLPGLTDVDVAAMTRSAASGLARGREAVLLNHANDCSWSLPTVGSSASPSMRTPKSGRICRLTAASYRSCATTTCT